MNVNAAMARTIAEFMILNKLNPDEITQKEFDALSPPYRGNRLKIHFMTFKRAMLHVKNQMERINAATPQISAKKPPGVRPVVKKPVVTKEVVKKA